MAYRKALCGSVAVAAVFSASTAFADLAADEVWQAWQDYAAAGGQSITGSEAREGGTLKVTAVTISSTADDLEVNAVIDEIVFVERDDGTVSVTMSDAYTMRVTSDEGDGVTLLFTQPGMRMVASGTDTGIDYQIQAPELTIAVTEVMGEDAPDVLDASVSFLGVNGSYEVPYDPDGPLAVDLAVAALNASFAVEDEDTEGTGSYAISGGHITFRGTGLNAVEEDPLEALRAGFSFDLSLSYDTLRYALDMNDFGERMVMAGSASDGDSHFVVNAQEVVVSSQSRNGEMTMSGDEIPFPAVNVKASELGFGLRVPMSADPSPQEVSLSARLVDLAITEDVWAMVDPTGDIPRTPATLIVDLVSNVILDADLFSEETAFAVMMGGPAALGALESLNLRELLFRVAGAELAGDGAFTFDNTDYETFPGMPRPSGILELSLRGGNALLDNLVEMGIIPPEEAMGARMMMALFTRPGEGQDELLTTLEVRDDGSVWANGQRIQ